MKRAILTVLAALLAVPLLGAEGCFGGLMGTSCNDAYYYCGFNLVLTRAGWPPGTRLEGTAGGEPFACTVGDLETGPSCDRDGIEVDPSLPGQVWLRFVDHAPKTIDLSVRAGDELLFAETFRPRYVTDEPNGEGCGKCTRATVERTVESDAAHCSVDGGCTCVRNDPCRCDQRYGESWYRHPWTVCPEGFVPPEECDRSTCIPCTGAASCVDDCALALPDSVPATCVGGTWTCTDPTRPHLRSACED